MHDFCLGFGSQLNYLCKAAEILLDEKSEVVKALKKVNLH